MVSKSTASFLLVFVIGIISLLRMGKFTSSDRQMMNDPIMLSKDTQLIQEGTRTFDSKVAEKTTLEVNNKGEESKPEEKHIHKHYNYHLNSNDANFQEMVDALGIREYLPKDDGKSHREKINMNYKLRVKPITG